MRAQLMPVLDAGDDLVVDLTRVRFLSSAGIGLLAEAAARGGVDLSLLVSDGTPAARMFALSGLGELLTVALATTSAS